MSWRPAGGDVPAQMAVHERAKGQAHTGECSEHVAISAGQGTAVYLAHDIGQPLVIEEMLPSVWVKSDRSGLQLLAQVVLPRTIDRRTGKPVSTLLAGLSYTQIGSWQQLRIDNLDRLLSRQIRVVRAEVGPTADEREAYIERLVLNVYGGPGWTNVWIDDLDIRSHVARTTVVTDPPPRAQPSAGPWVAAGTGAIAGPQSGRVKLTDAVLLVDDRPLFPRLLQHRGEPLTMVRQLGFNGVWLQQTASAELLREAERLGLWVVCPPPRPAGLDQAAGTPVARLEIGAEYDRVLAWHFGEALGPEQLEVTRRWTEQVRVADRRGNRPLLGDPVAELLAYSRHLDLLLQSARPLGTSLELTDYATWLRARAMMARPGTPFWTTIQTQLAPAVTGQLDLLDPGKPAPNVPASEQLRLLAYAAVGAGSHGLLFESLSPLTMDDPSTRQRAMALELLNLELSLVEPWGSSGTLQATVGANAANVGGALLRAEHKRLFIPAWQGSGSQYVAAQGPKPQVSLVVPGLPESILAYELLPGGLRSLNRERVSGGTQIVLEDFGLVRPVLLAQDPMILGVLGRQAGSAGPRAAELQRHLAVHKFFTLQETLKQLGRRADVDPQVQDALGRARAALQETDTQLASKDSQGAYLDAQRAMGEMRRVERGVWEAMLKDFTSPLASPAGISFAALPWHVRLADRLAASRAGANRLAGGDFEDINQMLASGWLHIQQRVEGVTTTADLAPDAARSGRRGMRLTARAEDEKNLPALFPTAAVAMVSPEVQAQPGELLCIRGWIRIKETIGGVDKLMIVESLCGESLAQRFAETKAPVPARQNAAARKPDAKAAKAPVPASTTWKQFVMYRVAPRYGPFRLSFALCGLGEVCLDDVSIQPVEPAFGGVPQQAVAPPGVPQR